MMGAEHRIAPITSTFDESQPRVSDAEQMRLIFHELHAEGRHALCAICDSQYRTDTPASSAGASAA